MDLPASYQPPTINGTQLATPNSLSKFDWAMRPNGGLIAIASPENVDESTSTVTDYQCVAMDFTLPSGVPTSTPFTSLLATVYDTDTSSSGASETNGPGACTYDPMSNTGIVIVRHLNQATSSGVGYDLYSIINSGIMP